MLTQRLLAHVPLLLHPDPKRVAILGLGSGVTLGSALTHPIERADVLEISPEVVDAARYFDAENHQATLDPRTRVIVGDGRTHLLLTRERYDVIVSEPSNPWMAGIASLFTREFFQAARARLRPGGVLCQWAHTYDISTDDLQSIVATFLSVFPDGTLWLVGDGDVLLVGFDQSARAAAVERRRPLAAAGSRRGPCGRRRARAVPRPVAVRGARLDARRVGARCAACSPTIARRWSFPGRGTRSAERAPTTPPCSGTSRLLPVPRPLPSPAPASRRPPPPSATAAGCC